MITKNELKIIAILERDLLREYTILQLKSLIKSNSYQRIYEATISLVKQKILSLKKIGKSNLIKLELNPQSINLISYLEHKKALESRLPLKEELLNLEEFREDILIVTGSYAKDTFKKSSDLDLAIITKEKAFEKQKLMENYTFTFHPQVHAITFTENDFKNMLLSKEENFGKEVLKNHLILRNAGRYFELIKEAIDNGFKG